MWWEKWRGRESREENFKSGLSSFNYIWKANVSHAAMHVPLERVIEKKNTPCQNKQQKMIEMRKIVLQVNI